MQFGSLSPSLYGLLAGLAPAGDVAPDASPSDIVSFTDALQSALAVGPLPATSGPATAAEGPRPVVEDPDAAPDTTEFAVAPLLPAWLLRAPSIPTGDVLASGSVDEDATQAIPTEANGPRAPQMDVEESMSSADLAAIATISAARIPVGAVSLSATEPSAEAVTSLSAAVALEGAPLEIDGSLTGNATDPPVIPTPAGETLAASERLPEAARLLSSILPQNVELHVDTEPRERPALSAATLVRDLGQSLANRPAAPAEPRPLAAPRAMTPPTAMAMPSTVTDPSATLAASGESSLTNMSSTSTVNEAIPTAPPIEAPVDREAPLRRESPLPAMTDPVSLSGESNVGAETGRQGSEASGEGSTDTDSAPLTAPLPATAMDAPPPAPVPSAGPMNDLQMQAQQAVARTVVRMGEDQLLASARPTSVRVQLSPSHLGQIQIEVSQNPQRGLDVTILAAVEETQRALEADADDMLDSLRSQKLDVTRVSVRSEGDRSDGDPRQRSDFFRNRDQGSRDDSLTDEGDAGTAHDRGGQSRGDQQPPHADPTDYRYWEAIR